MKIILLFISFIYTGLFYKASAQNITYSEIEKSDNRNLDFEILGKFSENFLIFKNTDRRREITIYDNNMSIKHKVNLDFISDRVSDIDFITYPEYFIIIWQFEKRNITRCRAAKINADGKLLGVVTDLDTVRTGLFSDKISYTIARSEDRRKILVTKLREKNDIHDLFTKVFDENLNLLDTSNKILEYNDRKEYFSDMQIDNEGTYVFTKVKHNARAEFINTLEVYAKRLRTDSLYIIKVPLNDQLIQDPNLKIDNVNNRYLLNSFSYRMNAGTINGIFTAVIDRNPFSLTKKTINIFNDSLREKLSGKSDWRTAFDNFNFRNIILKKDGGFIAVSEEYYKVRRFGNAFDDRFGSGFNNFRYGSASDYYLYNRGAYGYYRPFNDSYNRDIVYNYNDIISFSFTKDLVLQWNNVINKTTSDIENDNFLSFANMNAGAEMHFLFLQKDNNRQIISDHALQPDGSVIRYATLKGREAGYYFMPRLGRQTGLHQMIIPCIVRNNLAFAKIDF